VIFSIKPGLFNFATSIAVIMVLLLADKTQQSRQRFPEIWFPVLFVRQQRQESLLEWRSKKTLFHMQFRIACDNSVFIHQKAHAGVPKASKNVGRDNGSHEALEDAHKLRRLDIHFLQLSHPMKKPLRCPKSAPIKHL
jgi:hypothetical protein